MDQRHREVYHETRRKGKREMTIREIQEETANAFNGVEELVNGGCKAIAEDAQDVLFETRQALEAGNVCIVVATPKAVRSGGGTADGIPESVSCASEAFWT